MASGYERNSNRKKNIGANNNSNGIGPNINLRVANNLNADDINELSLSGSKGPVEASEVHQLSESLKKSMEQKIDAKYVNVLCEICEQYGIQPEFASYLPELENFEIAIVIDDSGSMNTKVDNTEQTRWSELCEFVKTIIDIMMKLKSRGIDIHFINGETYTKVKDPKFVDKLFDRTPRDYTPLVPTLEKIFTSELARRGRDKKLLVFVATDGEPTNEDGDPIIDEFKKLLKNTRDPKTTHLSFLLCTDDPDCVGYLRELDRTMEHFDVTDDYETEKREIRRCRKNPNYPFSHGDHIVKALVGGFIPRIDLWNEPEMEED